MEEYEFKEIPSKGGESLKKYIERIESEGWVFLEIIGSRAIYKRLRKRE